MEMEQVSELAKLLSMGGDAASLLIAFILFKLDRRVLRLEGEVFPVSEPRRPRARRKR